MLTFRMDESNFSQGERQGLRIVPGAGLKVDFDELAPDGQTLGLWHLHNGGCQGEGTGLEDASGGGHPLANYGAEAVEDGYRFVRTDNDRMDAGFPGQPERAALTLECWVRAFDATVSDYQTLAAWADAATGYTHRLFIQARAYPSAPASSHIVAELRVAGATVGQAVWTGTAAYAILTGTQPWHVAAVLDAPASFRLFVNGIQRAQDTTGILPLPATDYFLRLGRWPIGTSFPLSGILDEVRLSAAVRYAAAFTPQRLLADGTYDSLTFDAARIGADWVGLLAETALPPGCALAWEVRAADVLDGFGRPQALWQPYAGDPATLPEGRFFQWRATLSAAADHLATPTVESVEASASEAGYNLYHGVGDGPEAIDYTTPLGRVGPGMTEIATGPLAAGVVHWFGLRPADARELESPATQAECRLELDASGQVVPDRPAGVLALQASARPLGTAHLTWRWRPGRTGVLPQTFRIFGDGGTGTVDYETPLGEVPFEAARTWYAWDTPALADGLDHLLAVRAVAPGNLWDEQPAVASVRADAAAPAEVDALEAEVVL
jgi:hypothetical protein